MPFKFIQHSYGCTLQVKTERVTFNLMYLTDSELDELDQAIKDFRHEQQRSAMMEVIYAAVDRGEIPKCPECQKALLKDYCADGYQEVPCWACPDGCDEMWFPR